MGVTKPQLTTPPSAPRALLCIHGSGGSANIFRVQTAKLRMALRHEFEFVYATAPFESEPGPGVLPLFRGMGPYRSWFLKDDGDKNTRVNRANDEEMPSAETSSVGGRLLAVNKPVQKVVEDWQKNNPQIPIVGVIAFSEGALVAALLIWQQQMGRLPWFPKMDVAMFICCYYTEEATDYIKTESPGDQKSILIDVPSVHLQGLQDFALQGSRKLAATHFSPQNADILEFQGGHHIPSRKSDIDEAARRFLNLYKNRKPKALNA
ncbi:oxidoreductase [Colletotrichum higginsianum]|uniref:Oxidoreductase n=2 Tax=Colletotrichum higginsianum TaxID=80884 RepID=H1VUT9_COLHI|nr:Oxidoreductase [Colletotrichum higginsianum IMI 349063]OBR06533.1 Oxidoreductase [Colletotrichum higginsianum IMI 349063]TIC98004.1 Esterase mlcF [Colletotrichum higginsianum]CCF43998.1 oxidoreductase [Colletotrichum higginsianum]